MGDIFGGGGFMSKLSDPGDFMGGQAASAAQELSSNLGYQTLGMQQDWMDYIKGQFTPYSETGHQALGMQMQMLPSLSGGQPDLAAAARSPEFQIMNDQARNSLLASSEAMGGIGSTSTGNALGASSASILNQVANQTYDRDMQNKMNYFNSLGAISGRGMSGSQSIGSFGGDTLGGMAGTMSGIGSGALNSAAAQQQQGSGLLSAAGGLFAMFSDIRLKDNIKFTGKLTDNGNEIYTWDWNKEAETLGLYGSDSGVIADKAAIVTPEAVFVDDSGYKKVNYARV